MTSRLPDSFWLVKNRYSIRVRLQILRDLSRETTEKDPLTWGSTVSLRKYFYTLTDIKEFLKIESIAFCVFYCSRKNSKANKSGVMFSRLPGGGGIYTDICCTVSVVVDQGIEIRSFM